MICIPSLIPLSRGINSEVTAQIEEVAHVELVVYYSAPLGFFLRDDLANVFMDKITLLQSMFGVETPPAPLIEDSASKRRACCLILTLSLRER